MILKSYEIIKFKRLNTERKIILLHGENYGLKKEIKEIMKLSIDKKASNVEELTLFESEIAKKEEYFYNFIFCESLFKKKKIIYIYNPTDKTITHIKNIIDKFPKDIILVIFAEILEKKSKLRSYFETNNKIACIPCYLDTEKDLEILARQELRNINLILPKDSLNLIIRKSQGDRNNLRNELDKIKLFTNNNKKIDLQELKYLINGYGEIKYENLINTCLCGKIEEMKNVITDMSIETLNQILFLKILANKIKKLIMLIEQKNENQGIENLINNIKPPIFWKEKPLVKQQLTIWKKEELKKTIYAINDIEILCKKNPQVSSVIIFNFITTLCKKANC